MKRFCLFIAVVFMILSLTTVSCFSFGFMVGMGLAGWMLLPDRKEKQMLEILNFIFRDFWTFCGVVILLYVIGVYCITAPLAAIASIFNNDKNKEDE